MAEGSSSYKYLHDVLGITSFVRADGMPSTEVQTLRPAGHSPRVLVPRELGASEAAFLKKMLGSIHLEDYSVVVESGASNLILETSSGERREIFGLFEMANPKTASAEMNRLKKAAWVVLQDFKQVLEA